MVDNPSSSFTPTLLLPLKGEEFVGDLRSQVLTKPTCCAGGIIWIYLWSEYAAVVFEKTIAQQNPPRSPFRKGGR
jgi:hypothetical protein